VSALDRRHFLVRAGQAAAASAALPLLAGCGESGGTATAATQEAEAASAPNLSALRKAVKGTVFTRTTPGFANERRIFNSRFANVVPLAVVRAASVADVQATVRWAKHYGVPITARSGGHSYAGYSSVRNGVVVDVRGLHRISLGKGTAQIGAGNNLWAIYSALVRHGVTIPGGSCPTVGIAGLALGGGMGLAGRKYGLTLDSVKAVQVVTADGKVRNANAGSNEELYWACRGGGGGNFGVATAFTMQVHPAPNCAYFFATWPWADAEAVLGAWLRHAPKSNPNLTSICSLLGDGGGTPLVRLEGQFFGTEAQLRSTLAPIARDAPGGTFTYGTSSYMNLVKRWAGCYGQSNAQCSAYAPEAFNAGSSYVSKAFSSAGLRAAVRTVERSNAGALLFDCYGGAINEVSPTKTAFAHRDQLACIQYYANGTGNGWIGQAKADMKPYVSSSAYVNYIDPTVRGYQTAYYGANLPKLRQAKKTYDPDNLFKFPMGITPAS
jgi:FAD/FMN-containing dehydrogenase